MNRIPAIILVLLLLTPDLLALDKEITSQHNIVTGRNEKNSSSATISESAKSGFKSTENRQFNPVCPGEQQAQEEQLISDQAENIKESRFEITLNPGGGYLTAGTEKAEEELAGNGFSPRKTSDYYRNLKTGLVAGAEIDYRVNEYLNTGIRYRFFNTSSVLSERIDPQNLGNSISVTYQENIYLNYTGLSIKYSLLPDHKKNLQLMAGSSVGFVSYRNEAEYFTTFYLLKGMNLATDISLRVSCKLKKRISLGAEVCYFSGYLRKIIMTDGTRTSTIKMEKGNFENLSRLDLSLALKIRI